MKKNILNHLFFVFCLILLPIILFCQKNNNAKDSLLAIKYYNIADTSFMDVEKCIKYMDLAIPLLKKTKQWEKYVFCLASYSHCYNVKESYDSMELNNIYAFHGF